MTKFAVCPLIQLNESVIANAAARVAATAPAWVPEAATGYSDFESELYWAAGSVGPISTVLVENETWGEWDGTAVITGENYPVLTGAAVGSLLTEGTIVLTVDVGSLPIRISWTNLPGFSPQLDADIYENTTLIATDLASQKDGLAGVRRRAAFTIRPGSVSTSFCGEPAQVKAYDPGGSFTHVAFSPQDGTIVSFEIYAAVDDATLHGLSAL